MAKVLYLSHDGMTDPLGQSQVIPYLIGLSKIGHQISIISCEKPERYFSQGAFILGLLNKSNIKWHPLRYRNKPPIVSSIWSRYEMQQKSLNLHQKERYDIVHCRSYLTAEIGYFMQKKFKIPFIFDMRGFWADERVEGGIWNIKNPIYKKIYIYFKNKEKIYIKNADYIITLTHAAAQIIEGWQSIDRQFLPIAVIPCCVDLDHFNAQNISVSKQDYWRQKLGFQLQDFVLLYLGSVGTWYCLDEMIHFFALLFKQNPNARFLFLSDVDRTALLKKASKFNLPSEYFINCSLNRSDLPDVMSLAHMAIYFIRPAFSKQASSPTKMAEILSMGIPLITNMGIGDTNYYLNNFGGAHLITDLNETNYLSALLVIPKLLTFDRILIRQRAEKYFSLQEGIEQYNKIYNNLS